MKKLLTFLLLSVLLFLAAPAFAVTRYVAKTGSDANSCAASTSTSTPKLTIAAGLACMAAGDTVQIRTGEYAEIIKTSTQTIAAGTSWANAVTIMAYPGETVTIKPTGTPYAVVEMLGSTHKYIIFDGLIFDALNVTNYVVNAGGTAGHNRWINCEFKNSDRSSVLVGRDSHFNEFINNKIHDGGSALTGANCCGYGIYLQGSDTLVEGNEVYNHTGYGIHNYSGYTNGSHRNKIRKNFVHDNTTDSGATASAGILIGSGDGNIAEFNIVKGHPYGIMVGFNGATNSKVYHNTVYGATTAGVRVRASSSSTTIQNNILYNNVTAVSLESGATATQTTNRTSDPLYINPSGNDFGLQASSAAIDAGTAISGYPYNGAAPDQGAFETFTCTAVVPDTASDNTMVLTCTNNVATPLLPAASCTGFTARKNAADNAVTACTRTGDGQMTITLTSSYLSTDTADWSYSTSTGNVSNSALIGKLFNQRLNGVTNLSATNQVGASAPVLTQVAYRFECYGGTEAAPDCVKPLNTGISVPSNACLRWRAQVTSTVADADPTGFAAFAQKNGSGGYTAVPNGPTALAGLSYATGTGNMPPELIAGATTEHLAGANAFVPGGVMLSAAETPVIALGANKDTELVFTLCTGSGHTDGDYFDLRAYRAGGVALGAYTVTGRITIDTDGYVSQWGAP